MAEPDERLARWTERAGDEEARWASLVPGPPVAAVAARLSSVPRPFLDDRVRLAALAVDVLGAAGAAGLACLAFADEPAVRTGAAIGLWVLAGEELVEPFEPALSASRDPASRDPASRRRAGHDRSDDALAVDALALRVASASDPLDWLSDGTRREEAARTMLFWCGRLPAGEDAETARSMLAALDSLAQNRALAEAYAEHRHRAEVARRLAEARAKEAAARYSRE
ncbi:phosphohydrolase [Agromyces sp. MMS24-JH15]|uniref:phosphohydrolase n=1 Tax=Agromyces sp. MMS24-JH15 TaxID=3243765 RepID=UPI0037489719